jgi:quercetin dioxygenase-like cupin family protein
MAFLFKRVWGIMAIAAVPVLLWPQERADSLATHDRIFSIGNCVNHFDMAKTVKTSVGYQYWFIDKTFPDGRTLKMSVVAPHSATHEPHKHAEDEFFFVLQGTAEFVLDGARARGALYTSFYCPSNRLHGIRNAGEDTLKYLVIKKYGAEQK